MLESGFWTEIAGDLAEGMRGWLPNLLMAVVILLVGWLGAVVVRAVVRGVLRRLGLDQLSEKAGFADTLAKINLERSASALLGRIAYWLVVLFFVAVVLEGLGLSVVTETIGALVGYLPSVIASLLVLIVGGFLAHLAGDAVAAIATQYGLTGGVYLGQGVRWMMIVFSVILALEQLRLNTDLITSLVVVLVAAVALALALSFGLGARGLAGQIVAGLHAKDVFQPGQQLRVQGYDGRLVRIGSATAIIETSSGNVSIPNRQLLESAVLFGGEELGSSTMDEEPDRGEM